MLAKNRRENLLTHVKEARKLVEDAFDRALVGLGLPKDRDPSAAGAAHESGQAEDPKGRR